MIRPLTRLDLPRLFELQGDYEWTFGRDLIGALAVVDENDRPVMIAGAWMRAETHMLTDNSWATPQKRLHALIELHQAMERGLYAQGVGEVITYFDDPRTDGSFLRRLARLGWQYCSKAIWIREVKNV